MPSKEKGAQLNHERQESQSFDGCGTNEQTAGLLRPGVSRHSITEGLSPFVRSHSILKEVSSNCSSLGVHTIQILPFDTTLTTSELISFRLGRVEAFQFVCLFSVRSPSVSPGGPSIVQIRW